MLHLLGVSIDSSAAKAPVWVSQARLDGVLGASRFESSGSDVVVVVPTTSAAAWPLVAFRSRNLLRSTARCFLCPHPP